MAKPRVRREGPYVMTVGPGTLLWCRCGGSEKPPICDGHHEATGASNLPVELAKRETVAWCGCHRTRKPPDCDGTHEECWTNPHTN